ncbi:MAG: GNAT family N-acetyltransferase [Bacilli bacterium]|nr:GNAT family N-acetyltransferase [Bacilli bacterium]
MINLIKPCKELEKEIFEYQQEMIDFGDTNLSGCGSLEKYNNFEEWEEHLNSYADRKNLDPKSSYVEGSQYLLFDNEKKRVIGMVNLRHYLNVYLSQFGGHIGYSIRPSERRKGYGKLQLQLAIKKLREIT